MKLANAREHYYFHSGKASDIVRQLALAAIGIAWLFKTGSGSTFSLPAGFFLPLKLIVIALALDLLQYALGAAIWGFYPWHLARKGKSEDQDFEAPDAINWPAIAMFWTKIALVIAAYFQILRTVSALITPGA